MATLKLQVEGTRFRDTATSVAPPAMRRQRRLLVERFRDSAQGPCPRVQLSLQKCSNLIHACGAGGSRCRQPASSWAARLARPGFLEMRISRKPSRLLGPVFQLRSVRGNQRAVAQSGNSVGSLSHDSPVQVIAERNGGIRRMPTLTYEQLRAACSPGGSTALVSVTELAPAGGPHAAVAPARYVKGDNAVFAYETRFVDGEAVTVAVLDSKQSQLNRIEAAILQDIEDGNAVLGKTPRISVSYRGGEINFTDLELPHRAFDGHIRAGTVDGQSVTAHTAYRAARDASPRNARALLEMSPGSLVFGSWDSTRKTRQGRYRSALVGEIIGVLANQSDHGRKESLRGGARVDPVGMSVQLQGDDLLAIMNLQRDELSPKLIKKVEAAAKKPKSTSASGLGLGGIPPSLDALGAVACSRILRTHVLSFAALRQLRFGGEPAASVDSRALLAAYALAGLARSDSELYLRANCDLVESSPAKVTLDRRGGGFDELEPLSIAAADALLAEALARASKDSGITWDGQVFTVIGNDEIFSAASADSDEE